MNNLILLEKKCMKIIFFGTPQFSTFNLQELIDNKYKILAVVTAQDSQKGRGKKVQSSAVKKIAEEHNIPVLQPENLSNKKFLEKLKSYDADLYVVVAFKKLPINVWKLPKKGTINLHTSLLPNYRGAAPINWVLINNERKTGVSTFFINEKIDCGDIILQKEVHNFQKIITQK